MGFTIGSIADSMSPIAAAAVQPATSPDIVSGAAPGPGATPDGNIPAPGTTPSPTGGYGKGGPSVAPVTGGPDVMPTQPTQTPAAPMAAPGGMFGKGGFMPAPVTGGPDVMPTQPTQTPAAPMAAPGGMFGKGGFMPAPQAPQVAQPTQNPMIQKPAFQSQPYPTLPGYNADQQIQPQPRGLNRPTQNPLIRKPAFQGRGRGRVV